MSTLGNAVTGSWVGVTSVAATTGDAVTGFWTYLPETIDGTEVMMLSGPSGTTLLFAQTVAGAGPFAILLGNSQDGKLSPRGLWPNYASDGTSITFALADLDNLTAAEAANDAREVLQSILLSVSNYLEPQPYVDRPRMLVMSVYNDWNYPHPALGHVIRREMWFRTHVNLATRRVADEP